MRTRQIIKKTLEVVMPSISRVILGNHSAALGEPIGVTNACSLIQCRKMQHQQHRLQLVHKQTPCRTESTFASTFFCTGKETGKTEPSFRSLCEIFRDLLSET